MPNLTLRDYVGNVYKYRMEDSSDDGIDTNELYQKSDVIRAINETRYDIVRRIGLGINRKQVVTNAVQGEFSPPVDLFAETTVFFKTNSNAYINLKVYRAGEFTQANPASLGDNVLYGTNTPSTLEFSLGENGLVCKLWPPLNANVQNSLIWQYNVMPEELVDDEDECPIMNMFPEHQSYLLPAGALWRLTNIEAGAVDGQQQKFFVMYENGLKSIRSSINSIFKSNRSYR